MKSNRHFQIVPQVVVLLAIVVLAACTPTNSIATDDFNYAKAADVHAARWQAMADYYARHDMLNDEPVANAEATRLQAIADSYKLDRAAAAEAARLNAMARANSDELFMAAQTARWDAIAESYTDRAAVAETARWNAIASVNSVTTAETARWEAIAGFYADADETVTNADGQRLQSMADYFESASLENLVIAEASDSH